MSQTNQVIVQPVGLTPEEAELQQLLQAYRAASDEVAELSPEAQQAVQKRQEFLEKFLDFREQVGELRQALAALKELNAKQQHHSSEDLQLFESYLHSLTQTFIQDCKQVPQA